MRINHNIQALNTYRQLSVNQKTLSKHLEKLSSGLRINRAADDAAGLAISEKMRSQIRGLKVADRNALDGISMIQTAEGALGESHNILQRMRELAVQASNGALTPEDRGTIQSEIDQLTLELDRISDATDFNGKSILAGNIDAKSFAVSSIEGMTHAGGGVFQGTSSPNEDVYISFLEPPVNGDNVNVDGVPINFTNGTAVNYDPATDIATIGIDGKSVEDIVSDINTVLGNAKTDGQLTNVNTHSIIGNSIVLEAGGTGIPVEYTDPDFAPKPDEEAYFDMQIGSNESETMGIKVSNMDTASLGIAREADHTTIISVAGENAKAGVDVSSSRDAAESAIGIIDRAIEKVTNQRSNLGAYQNRLEHTIKNLGTTTENLTASESRIRDVDMALEMAGFTKANILNQAATAMLAQANQMPQGILQLLQ